MKRLSVLGLTYVAVLAVFAQTNAVPPLPVTDDTLIDHILRLLNQLWGMPAHVMVGLTCIIWGYTLRFIKRFPNDGIPLTCVLWGMAFTPLVADPHGATPLRVWVFKNILMGAVVGAGAWALHKWVLKRIETKIPFLGDLLAEADAKSDDVLNKKADVRIEASAEAARQKLMKP